jgi:hypothetical protein
MSYNGWSNYETWNVALWLSNEEGTESDCVEMAREAWEDADDDTEATQNMAKRLESYVDDMMPDIGPSMFSDILGAAMSEVDWHEIASHYVDDNKPEPEEATE